MTIWNPFFILGVMALATVLQVAFFGDRAVPSAGLHPHFTRATVISARVALTVLTLLVVGAIIA